MLQFGHTFARVSHTILGGKKGLLFGLEGRRVVAPYRVPGRADVPGRFRTGIALAVQRGTVVGFVTEGDRAVRCKTYKTSESGGN